MKEHFALNKHKIWRLICWNGTRTHNHLVHKRTLNHWTQLAKWPRSVGSTHLYSAFDCIFLSCHVWLSKLITLYSSLNVEELFARNKHKVWMLIDFNGTQTHNSLVRTWTLNIFAKLAKWLRCVLRVVCIVHLTVCSNHVTYTFQSGSTFYTCLNVKGFPCSKQAQNLKFNWVQRDSIPQPLSS